MPAQTCAGFRWAIQGKVGVAYHGLSLGMPAQTPYGVQVGNTGQSWCDLPWAEAGHAHMGPARDFLGAY